MLRRQKKGEHDSCQPLTFYGRILLALALLTLTGCESDSERQNRSNQRRANLHAAKMRMGDLSAALDRYRLDMHDYPTTAQGLKALLERPDDAAAGSKWGGPYLQQDLPADPWGRPYKYAYPPRLNRGKPDIWSVGPDGEDGTADDIFNLGQ